MLAAAAARGRGDPVPERRHLEQALAIYAELGAPEIEELRHRLDTGAPGAPAASAIRHQNDPPGN